MATCMFIETDGVLYGEAARRRPSRLDWRLSLVSLLQTALDELRGCRWASSADLDMLRCFSGNECRRESRLGDILTFDRRSQLVWSSETFPAVDEHEVSQRMDHSQRLQSQS